jgi:hypothetical protein
MNEFVMKWQAVKHITDMNKPSMVTYQLESSAY